MAQPASGQFMASKLIGTSVVGQNNETIGDVNDVLMDRSGKAVAVLIGVGGFLGIGEKDVAVPFDRIEMTAANGSNGPATTGSTSTGSTSTGSSSNTSASNNGAGTAATTSASSAPNRLMIKMSKQELESAPRFSMSGHRDGAATGSTSGGSDMNRPGTSSTTGGTTTR
jgi:sporulation protein YlmC with PRC-barrel domain